MRKTITLKLTATLFLLLIASFCVAQNHVKVYGNVGVENVNISVLNTGYGTSSDKNGDYRLIVFKLDSIVNLSFTCVGYYDTIVAITPKMFAADSVGISFKMKKIIYNLPEATLTATNDFYRSRHNSAIVDISFVNDKVLVLENCKDKTELRVLDGEGNEIEEIKYDSVYKEIFIDCFGNHILLGDNVCLQVYLNENNRVGTVTMFSRQIFKNKLQNALFEFSNAYIFRDRTFEKFDYYVHNDHNQSQGYFYIKKQDTTHEKRMIVKFFNLEAMKTCQSYLAEIIATYNAAVPPHENVVALGFWDGNLIELLLDNSPKLTRLIGWYASIEAAKLNTTVVKTDTTLYFIDLDRYEIVEVDTAFNITNRRPLQIQSGEKRFKNQFITDDATGKSYGVFQKDGVYYVGLFDVQNGSVSMTTRASNYIYPRVLKINNGYAYGVYFDADKHRWFVNRVKIE